MYDLEKSQQRPDGDTSSGIGWLLIAVGLIALFFVGSDDPRTIMIGLAVSQLGIGLGVLLISLGYLVRAIWHLPGRAIEAPTPEAPAKCEWCDLEIMSPNRPCSAVDWSRWGRRFFPDNDVCKAKLEERDIEFDG